MSYIDCFSWEADLRNFASIPGIRNLLRIFTNSGIFSLPEKLIKLLADTSRDEVSNQRQNIAVEVRLSMDKQMSIRVRYTLPVERFLCNCELLH